MQVGPVLPALHWPVPVSQVRPAPQSASAVHFGVHTLSTVEQTVPSTADAHS